MERLWSEVGVGKEKEEEEKVAHTQCVNGGRGVEKSESRER